MNHIFYYQVVLKIVTGDKNERVVGSACLWRTCRVADECWAQC